jgi:hypothetical protein
LEGIVAYGVVIEVDIQLAQIGCKAKILQRNAVA